MIACTLAGVGSHTLSSQQFDIVVIDEAAQALEPACWCALLKGRKAVLAGDHLQLPPTVVSATAAQQGLGDTLFARVQGGWPQVSRMLTVQYRMHAAIMQWSSEALYGGRLQAHASVAGHCLKDLAVGKGGVLLYVSMWSVHTSYNNPALHQPHHQPQHAEHLSDTDAPVLLLVDTAGCDMEEVRDDASESTANPGEASVTIALVQRLLDGGLRANDIGVITPYSAQVAMLRGLREESWKDVEVSTVDGFQGGCGGNKFGMSMFIARCIQVYSVYTCILQTHKILTGREKEAIIISMVRSNSQGEVGFLSDRRRMNVAVTRARRHCACMYSWVFVGGGYCMMLLCADGNYNQCTSDKTHTHIPPTQWCVTLTRCGMIPFCQAWLIILSNMGSTRVHKNMCERCECILYGCIMVVLWLYLSWVVQNFVNACVITTHI